MVRSYNMVMVMLVEYNSFISFVYFLIIIGLILEIYICTCPVQCRCIREGNGGCLYRMDRAAIRNSLPRHKGDHRHRGWRSTLPRGVPRESWHSGCGPANDHPTSARLCYRQEI